MISFVINLFRWLRKFDAILILALGITVFVLAFAGLVTSEYSDASTFFTTRPILFVDYLYQTAQLFLLNFDHNGIGHNIFIQSATIGAVMLVAIGAFTILFRLWDDARFISLYPLRWFLRKRHIVICGLSEIGSYLAKDCRRAKSWRPAVIIESDLNHPDIQICRDHGQIVLIGDATDPTLLARAHAKHADKIFAVTDSDSTNLEIATQAITKHGHQPQVRIHLQDVTQTELANHELFGANLGRGVVRAFNSDQITARRFVEEQLTSKLPPHDGVAHYVLVGFGSLGQALALQIVRQAHFANRKKIRLTIFDDAQSSRVQIFKARYPFFTGDHPVNLDSPPGSADEWFSSDGIATYACNAEFLDLPAEPSDPNFGKFLANRLNQQGIAGQIIVCLDGGTNVNLHTALHIRNYFRTHDQEYPKLKAPIHIWMNQSHGLARMLSEDPSSDLYAFGWQEKLCTCQNISGEWLDRRARIIHENYCKQRSGETNIGSDPAMKPWDELTATLQDSNRQQADHISIKLRLIGCDNKPADQIRLTPEEIELLAEIEHNRWMAERLLAGWRYGTTKDKPHKITTDLVPFSALPEKTKDYDRNTIRNIPVLLCDIKESIIRTDPSSLASIPV